MKLKQVSSFVVMVNLFGIHDQSCDFFAYDKRSNCHFNPNLVPSTLSVFKMAALAKNS